ncbi:3' terminal RNA ribose 2'-O-methyltransferase Hen1 [Schlesneria paludicola]|uniref:3' terminal RNA ribose 2'-O-methyltransferase Hen1 n=1 Tax=Schlesneria paludicola TaxID=360056 RepID=UPI0004925B50|nr:3' terminal RNA ribose 2'-O-methyltransferase Hen1 [Schlesneria paludicola]
MLLTISTTHAPATDLGFLLHKHPDRCQTFSASYGSTHVFYPEATDERTTVALLLEVDPVGLVRNRRYEAAHLAQYVNDRPYVASSFLSVAIAQVFRSALNGRCEAREELARTPIPLSARLDVLPVRGGEDFLRKLFEPLGYSLDAQRYPLDEQFPEWGDSPYYSVTISGTKRLSELLTHLYVLIPVFDNQKHYHFGDDEIEKLLDKASVWLADHPEKDQIARRYLGHKPNLYREALARLIDDEVLEEELTEEKPLSPEVQLEEKVSLNEQRLGSVLAALRASGAQSVIDLGCGEGKLLREVIADRQFQRILGMDVSVRALEIAQRRLKLDRLPESVAERVQLIHGSLIYRDKRLSGFDAAALVEVIEHLDPPRLSACERVIFEFAHPKTVIVTTPNQEYNTMWETLPAGQFRHADHRFEWTRQEFQDWSNRIAERHGYTVEFVGIGPNDPVVGSPTQMSIFQTRDAR